VPTGTPGTEAIRAMSPCPSHATAPGTFHATDSVPADPTPDVHTSRLPAAIPSPDDLRKTLPFVEVVAAKDDGETRTASERPSATPAPAGVWACRGNLAWRGLPPQRYAAGLAERRAGGPWTPGSRGF